MTTQTRHTETISLIKNVFSSNIKKYKMHILRQDQNLHNENAEKDQTGAGDIVFKGRQVCCSVLKRLRKKMVRHSKKDV